MYNSIDENIADLKVYHISAVINLPTLRKQQFRYYYWTQYPVITHADRPHNCPSNGVSSCTVSIWVTKNIVDLTVYNFCETPCMYVNVSFLREGFGDWY